MTDKEKLDKLVAEIERLKATYDIDLPYGIGAYTTCETILSFIDSMQENPKDKCKGCNNVKGCITCVDGSEYAHIEESKECMYSKDNYTDEDRKALCDGCKNKSITDNALYEPLFDIDLGLGIDH